VDEERRAVMTEGTITVDEALPPGAARLGSGAEAARWLEELVAKGTLLPSRALLLSSDLEEEAVALSRAGFRTLAVDEDRGALADLRKRVKARGAEVDVITADIFATNPSFFGPVELIVDRTLFHRLEPVRRAGWADRIARILPPGGHVAALFRVGRMPGGPPYAIPLADLKKLLSRRFHPVLLEDAGGASPGSDRTYRALFRRL
jgi:hypothetical protein